MKVIKCNKTIQKGWRFAAWIGIKNTWNRIQGHCVMENKWNGLDVLLRKNWELLHFEIPKHGNYRKKKNLLKCKPLKSNTRLHQSVAKAFLEEIHFHHYQIWEAPNPNSTWKNKMTSIKQSTTSMHDRNNIFFHHDYLHC